MNIELDAESHDSKNVPESNDESHCESSEDTPNDVPDKINARYKSKRQKDSQIELNYFQMTTCDEMDKIEEIKPQNKHAKSSQLNEITNLNFTSDLSSDSSTEDDIYQTRYSIHDKDVFNMTSNVNDYASNLTGNNSDDTFENISNMNTSPIIIQAKAYDKKENPVIDKQLTQTKKEREISLLKETKSKIELREFNIEENSLNTGSNIESNFIQTSDDAFEADFNFSNNISTKKSNKKCIKGKMVDAILMPKEYSVNKNKEKFSIREKDIADEFFNGSFDITKYQVKSSKTTGVLRQYENNKLKSEIQTKGGKRSNCKRKMNELVTANKRVKHETILKAKNKKNTLKAGVEEKELNKKPEKKKLDKYGILSSHQKLNKLSSKEQKEYKMKCEKNDSVNSNINFSLQTDSPYENSDSFHNKNQTFFHHFPKTLVNDIETNVTISDSDEWERMSITEARTMVRNKKHPKKNLSENETLNSCQKLNKISNILQPREKKSKDFDSFNININFLGLTDGPYENRLMKLKNRHMKYEDKNTYDTEEDSIKNKYSRRKVRSSSRIASKRIKEIEKMENFTDPDEVVKITDEEIETNYDELLNTHQEHNNMETLYSLRENSNTPCTNRKKQKRKNSTMLTKNENGLTAIKEREDVCHSETHKNNTKRTDDIQISRPIIHLLKSSHSSEIPTKQNKCINNKKYQTSSSNSFYSNILDADPNFSKNNPTFEKRSKIDIDSKNSNQNHHSSRSFMDENSNTYDINNITVSKESKPRTWEMLENELLNDLDNEQLSDDVCKTVILKKQETVMKEDVTNDINLFTVSNTSMLQTISKSKTGNNYNLKYEIKNTKSKFVGPKTDPTYNFKNTTIAQQVNKKKSNVKSNAIVNKTIAAMEKCTAKFIAPEVELCNADQMVSNKLLKNDNTDTHQETQFHSHMTFMAHGDKYYSNKIVGYTKKNIDSKSLDFDQKDRSKAISSLSETQRNKKSPQKAMCTDFSYKSTKNILPTESVQNHINYDKTKALVPHRRERNNPWQNLMDKLHLQEEDQGLNEVTSSISNCEIEDENTESLVITKSSIQNSNNLERNETLLMQADCEDEITKQGEEILSDQQVVIDVESDIEQSKIHVPKIKKISITKNSALSTSHQSKTDKMENKESNICKKLELKKVDKLNRNKMHKKQMSSTESKTISKKIISKKQSSVKSPSFKLKTNRLGTLKLKIHSSGSSSSNISEDSTELKKAKLDARKGSKCNTSLTNKAREKYKTYLKKLFEDQNPVVDEDKTKTVEDNTVFEKNIHKELSDKSQNLRKTKDSLIARQQDDIFSLSSSDESSNENYGTGLVCELFDE